MLGGGSPSEHTIADQASTHLLTDDDEYLANLVGAGGCYATLLWSSVVSEPIPG